MSTDIIEHSNGTARTERFGGLVNTSGSLWRDKPPATARRPGAALIGTAAWLLAALALGLLAVSLAAQYRYIDGQRHQALTSGIEAGALDIGMIIFSLLALGLARAGQSARIERGLVVACAAGSALMNYAAADVTSPRSVLAFVMPPVFLAIVVDRVVVVVRRHVLGTAPAETAAAEDPAAEAVPLSKRARLLAAYDALAGVDERHGDRSKISQLAAELAGGADLQPGTARTYLYSHHDKGA